MMEKSTVKWFDSKKGFGFLVGTEKSNNQDIFVHFSQIDSGEVREGDEVSFQLTTGEKGMAASNVEITKLG